MSQNISQEEAHALQSIDPKQQTAMLVSAWSGRRQSATPAQEESGNERCASCRRASSCASAV
eukprot:4406561-Prymnesium_polylepis.1